MGEVGRYIVQALIDGEDGGPDLRLHPENVIPEAVFTVPSWKTTSGVPCRCLKQATSPIDSAGIAL